LTERDWDILEYLADGLTAREVAAELGLRKDSVSRQLRRMAPKIGAKTTRRCLVRAIETELLVVLDGKLQRNPLTWENSP
jgi:DNA-binding NarL/FixJ family response regulator